MLAADRAVGLGLLLGANLATAAHQGTYAGSTTYFYGARGQREAGEWLRGRVAPGEVVVADREVTYYAGSLHYVDSERLMALAGDTDDVSRLPVGRARWIASRHPRVAALLPAGAAQVAAFGDYRIWAIPAATAGP